MRQPPTEPLSAPLTAHAVEQTQMSKYHTKGGLGFAAEDANHVADRVRGRHAESVGKSNDLNGPDRIVNGLKVQSKYCQSASETVKSAFDQPSGSYRYPGQVLEVPRDQYEDCVELMREKISAGKVPGSSNPADAEKIIRKGMITHTQARNIARAGNIDSLVFDAESQAITVSGVFAISFCVAYAHSKWRGDDSHAAVRNALEVGLAAGCTTLVTGVVGAQLLRTKAAAIGVTSVENGLKSVSRTALGRKAIHQVATGSLRKAVTGVAAVKHVAKLVRSNAVTAAVAAVVTSTPDFYRATFDKSISWRQFVKNTSINVVGVASGTAGWIGGAAAGAAIGSVVPVVGTAAGAVAGAFGGALGVGIGGAKLAKVVADRVVDDDSKKLLQMIQDALRELACEYLLTEAELDRVGVEARRTLTAKCLRGIFKRSKKGSDRDALVVLIRKEFEPLFESIVSERPRIILPSPETLDSEILLLAGTTTAADGNSIG
jgi:hypothetical protein